MPTSVAMQAFMAHMGVAFWHTPRTPMGFGIYKADRGRIDHAHGEVLQGGRCGFPSSAMWLRETSTTIPALGEFPGPQGEWFQVLGFLAPVRGRLPVRLREM